MELTPKHLEMLTHIGDFCALAENADSYAKEDFIEGMTRILPRIYLSFMDSVGTEMQSEVAMLPSYVDEDYYDAVRRKIEMLLGPDDVFLETFEEDMRYSETPIAVSISESIADIFQPLYDFISAVKESEGESFSEAFSECHDNFEAYWSQTLVNVLRPLNHLRFHPDSN